MMEIVVQDGDVHVNGNPLTPVQTIMLARTYPRGSDESRALTLAATVASEQRRMVLAIIAMRSERMARQERSKFK